MIDKTIGTIDKLKLTVLIENSPAYDTYLEGCFGLSLARDVEGGNTAFSALRRRAEG